ncbi:Allergen Asp f 7 [Rhodotorula toruloides]|nr:Allergen Asp f 7 [Rhodotorula toruloides]
MRRGGRVARRAEVASERDLDAAASRHWSGICGSSTELLRQSDNPGQLPASDGRHTLLSTSSSPTPPRHLDSSLASLLRGTQTPTMRSLTLPLIAAAALSLGSTPAAASVGSSSHGLGSVAHHRRFDRVMRTPAEQPDAQPVIDLDFRDGEFVVRNSTLDGDLVEGGNKTLVKRGGYSGRATFFDPGLGACGTHSSSSDFMVALNEAQYGDLGAVSKWCFQTITISYGGKSAQAQILDACPGCPYGGLDMSPALFQYFASPSVGVFYMTWSPGSGGGDQQTTTTKPPPPPTITSDKPTTTWTPPTTTCTTSSSSSSSVLSSSSNSTSSALSTASHSASASESANIAAASPSMPATAVGGNLDNISQLVLAMGNIHMRALIANLLAALRSLASYAPPSCSLVIVAAVAALMPTPRLQERLPTEILSAIISFDYLTWPALDSLAAFARSLFLSAARHHPLRYQLYLVRDGIAGRSRRHPRAAAGRTLEGIARTAPRSVAWRSPLDRPGARVGPWRSTFAWRGYDDEEEDDEDEDRAPIHAYEQLAEDLLCEESLGEDEADYLPDILNAFPNVRSLRLEGCEYFSTADSVEYLVECLPNLREVMTIATRAERGRGPEDGKDSSDQSAEEELGQALEEEGIRFIPLNVLTEQDSPSPRSVDEGEEPVDQGSHAIPTDDVIDLAALSRLERLPTEILTAIISYDHLSWNDFDACSRVSRRIRQIALPERGSLPALPIILARTEHDESEIVEVPTSACHYKRSLNDDDLCEEIRRVEIYKVRGPENSIELLEEWDPTFFELRGIASHEKDMYEYLADARADELIAEYGVGGGGGWETVVPREYPDDVPEPHEPQVRRLWEYQSLNDYEELVKLAPFLREFEVVDGLDEGSQADVREAFARIGIRYESEF